MFLQEIFSPDRIYLTIALLATLALLLVSILAGLVLRRRQRQLLFDCRFRPQKNLMEGAERRCFQLLNDLFGQKYYVIPNVELSAVLNPRVGAQDHHAAYNLIQHRTIDFVLCNKRTLRPVCAVKISDSKDDRIFQPGDLEKFFHNAHLPFVYLPRKHSITRANVIDQFSRAIYDLSS